MKLGEDLKKQRQNKLNQIEKLGFEIYPYKFVQNYSIKQIIEQSGNLIDQEQTISIAGRILAIRGQGKASFIELWEAHNKLQLYLNQKNLEKEYELFKYLDIGDCIGVKGELFKTRSGEITIRVKKLQILAKSLQPFPVPKEKITDDKKVIYDEFTNKETRYRKRYLDLILNQKSFTTFIQRTQIIKSIRNYLDNNGYLDVETPTLQPIYGGANAEPFVTKHKSLNLKLYLRISNELFLKRCLIGGLNKVYEIGKDFRNEGIDKTHNPEFTMIEFYEAYADYNDMMIHFENIYREGALKIHQKTSFEYDGKEINLSKDWKRLSLKEAILQYATLDVDKLSDDELFKILKDNKQELQEYNRGLAITKIFDLFCPQHLIDPVFIIDHPKESTPLCKIHRKNPSLIERFEPYIMGWELGNAYSELNDPTLQREFLIKQEAARQAGEQDRHPMDEDFLTSLEYGMPPAGGVGLGIDRMTMLLTNQKSIRDVILFPLLK